MDIANGLYEGVADICERHGLTIRKAGFLADAVISINNADIAQIAVRGHIVKLWCQCPGNIRDAIFAFVKTYLGHGYEGGGIDFDLHEPDSLENIEAAIIAILADHAEYLKTNGSSFDAAPATPHAKTL